MSTSVSSTPPMVLPAVKKARSILYADDMPELRELMKMALTRDGYYIEIASDGAEAWTKLSAPGAHFDLLITDHHMPNMTGIELIAQLRTTPFNGKIMVFSSELSHEVQDRYHDLGVDKILYKPVPPSVMRHTLNDLLAPAAVK